MVVHTPVGDKFCGQRGAHQLHKSRGMTKQAEFRTAPCPMCRNGTKTGLEEPRPIKRPKLPQQYIIQQVYDISEKELG